MGITGPFADHARARPDDSALTFGADVLTWRELDRAVRRLAGAIRASVPEGGSIALDLPNGMALALLFLASAAAGRNALMLEPDWPVDVTRGVLDALGPDWVVTSRSGLRGDERVISGDLSARDLLGASGAPEAADTVPAVAPESIFYTGFTSGSSGQPKGFFRSQASWLASFAGAQAEFGIGGGDVVLAPGPFSHSTAVYALADGLHAGAHVVLTRGFQARSVLRAVREHRVSVLYAVPTQLRLLIDAMDAGESPAEVVRLVLSTGAKWPDDLTARLGAAFPNALFAEFYGASELSFVALARGDEEVPAGSVGRAFPGVTITVRDRAGRRLPTGRTGLVFAESALTFGGYAMGGGEVLRAGAALSVGDRGFLDARGFLHLRGRMDRMVIVSGRNVQPEASEAVLVTHPAVAEAAVIGLPDARRGAALLALVVVRDGVAVSRTELVRHLQQRLPGYMVPRRFASPPCWPRTRSQKPDLPKLARLWTSGQCAVLE